MKNLTTTLFCALLSVISFAQVTNGGFEDWTIVPTFMHPDVSPADFTSINNEIFYETGMTACTEVAGQEGSGVRVETVEFEGLPRGGYGITGNTPVGEDLIFSDGFPFSDMAVSGISFDARYNISFLSPGFLIVQFLADGIPVTGGTDDSGTFIIPIFGTQATWTNIDYAFADPLTQVPDECIIAFASNNVIDETGFVGNYLEIDNIDFIGTAETMPGGDFNTWIEVDSGETADDWDTFLPPNFGFVTKSDVDPLSGIYNVELNTIEIIGEDTIQSMIYQAELNEFGLFPNQTIPANAYAFEFNYKYSTAMPDSATVYFLLSEEEDPLPEDIAFVVQRMSTTGIWTNRIIDFTEIMPSANYYGVLFASGMGFDESTAVGSVLSLDDVGFLLGDECEFTPTIIEGDISICPGDNEHLSTQLYDEYTWWTAELGETIFEESSSDSILDLSEAESGIYEIYLEVTLDGCTAISEIITLEVFDIPSATASVDGEFIIEACHGETVIMEVENADDYVDFQWILLGFDIPDEMEFEYEALAVLNLTSIFVCEVSTAECPDINVMSNGVTLNSHSAPIIIIGQVDNVLSTQSGLDSYQWYLNGTEISGAEDSTYEILESGTYSVVASNEWGCFGQSLDFDAAHTSIDENQLSNLIVYPNPAKDHIVLSGLNAERTLIEINDLAGNKVFSELVFNSFEYRIDLSEFATGTYLITIQSNDWVQTKRIVLNR